MRAPIRHLTQAIIHDPLTHTVGDCFRTCVAMLLGLDASDVPHFCADNSDGHWFRRFTIWLMINHGCSVVHIPTEVDVHFSGGQAFIANGMSPRGIMHSVVRIATANDRGFIEYDPHPSRDGLSDLRSIEFITVGVGSER